MSNPPIQQRFIIDVQGQQAINAYNQSLQANQRAISSGTVATNANNAATGRATSAVNSQRSAVTNITNVTNNYTTAVNSNTRAATSNSSSFSGLTTTIAGYTIGIGGALLVTYKLTKSLIDTANRVADLADNLDESSQKIGVSIGFYQQLSSISQKSGVNIEGLTTSMRALGNTAVEASQKSGEARDAYAQLGVTVTDSNGQLKKQEVLFKEVLLALSDMPQGFNRAVIGTKLLGRSSADLNTVLNLGSKELKNQLELNSSAVTVTQRLADAGSTLKDRQQEVAEVWSGYRNKALLPLIETMSDLTESFLVFSRSEGVKSFVSLLDRVSKGANMAFSGVANAIGLTKPTPATGISERDSFERAKKYGEMLDQIAKLEKKKGNEAKIEDLKRDALHLKNYEIAMQKKKAIAEKAKEAEIMANQEKIDKLKAEDQARKDAIEKAKADQEKATADRIAAEKKATEEAIKWREQYYKKVDDLNAKYAGSAKMFSMGASSAGFGLTGLGSKKGESALNPRSASMASQSFASTRGGIGLDFQSSGLGDEIAKEKKQKELDDIKAQNVAKIQLAQSYANTVGELFTGVYDLQRKKVDEQSKSEIDAINASTMSQKDKAKAIDAINKKAQKEKQEIDKKNWAANVVQSIANTALAVTQTMATMGFPAGIPFAIAAGAAGAVQTGLIIANKPKFYHGSKDSTGQYQEIGGNSAGDMIPATVRTGELIVKAGEDARRTRQMLNGKNQTAQSISFGGISVNISGNADQSILPMIRDEIQRGVVSVIEGARFSNAFHPAFGGR